MILLTSLLRWQNFHPFHLVKIPTQTNNRIAFSKRKKKKLLQKKTKIYRGTMNNIFELFILTLASLILSGPFQKQDLKLKCLKAEWSGGQEWSVRIWLKEGSQERGILVSRISKMQICLFSALWPKNEDNRHC